MALPLRLKVEPFAKSLLNSCHILPSADEEKICFIVADAGWVATVVSELSVWNVAVISQVTGLPEADVPKYAVVQCGDCFNWYSGSDICAEPPARRDLLRSVMPITARVAEAVVGSIAQYYGRQVLEPSIRGFLAILEKQFPRNDLYLFELLQNAVDDGANRVSLKQSMSGGKAAIHFCHNGRGFTPLDVLGLSSVGLSTKGEEEKRKIGFMGIGFKAVYKRFAKVTVFDNTWSFQFEQPSVTPPMEPTFSWVLKPSWVSDMTTYRNISYSSQDMSPSPQWCNFMLERSRGGDADIRDDLSRLHVVVPVLLGRQAVDPDCSAEEEDGKWILAWGEKVYSICKADVDVIRDSAADRGDSRSINVTRDKSIAGRLVGAYIDAYKSTITHSVSRKNSSIRHMSTIRDAGGEDQMWQFLTLCFEPSTAAKTAFEGHTKRPWKGKKYHTKSFFSLEEREPTAYAEEISLFFQITQSGEPILSQRQPNTGLLHAVLPTKLKLPFAMNLQASWLLSVDRQEVQNLTENAWNHCLISQLPDLIILLLKWIAARNRFSQRRLDLYYALLPPIDEPIREKSAPSSKAFLSLLGQNISITPIIDAIKKLNIAPVIDISSESSITFKPGIDAIWIPAPLAKLVPPHIIHKWFGKYPFASAHLGAAAWHPFWLNSLPVPTSDMLSSRRQQFDYFKELSRSGIDGDDLVLLTFKVMTALAECVDLKRPSTTAVGKGVSSAGLDNKFTLSETSEQAADTLCDGLLPSLSEWPIFPTDNGNAVSCRYLALPNPGEFSQLSPEIAECLREGVRLAVVNRQIRNTSSHGSNSSRDHSSHKCTTSRVSLLDPKVEKALYAGDGWVLGGDEATACQRRYLMMGAKRCLDILELINPEHVVGVDNASQSLLQEYAVKGNKNGFSDNIMTFIVNLTKWAHEYDRPSAISHFFALNDAYDARVESRNSSSLDSKYVLLPVGKCYIPNFLVSEECGGKRFDASLSYVAANLYSKEDPFDARSFEKFLIKCGVQNSVVLVGQNRLLTELEKSFLPDKKTLPQLRQSNTSADLLLPFGFGVFNRKKHYVIDMDMAPEWIRIIGEASRGNVNAAISVSAAFASLLMSADVNALASAVSSPYVAQLLHPNANPVTFKANSRRGGGNQLLENRNPANKGVLGSAEVQHNEVLFPAHRIPQNRDIFPPALFARLYYLPPGQPGAATIGLGPAAWIYRLANERWIPACPPGSIESDSPSVVLRPCEVLLLQEPAAAEMPTARLPKNVLKILLGLKREINDVLAWGSVKPRPPLERFTELISSIDKRRHKNVIRRSGVISVSASEYDEVVKLWSLLCLAQQESRLTTTDLRKIRSVCGGMASHSERHGNSGVCFLPGPRYALSPNTHLLLSHDMCMSIAMRHPSRASELEEWDEMTAIALSQVGYIADFGAREYDTVDSERILLSHVSADDWPLNQYRSELNTIISPSVGYNLSIASAELLRFLSNKGLSSCTAEMQVYHPDEKAKTAFTLATWAIIRECLYDNRCRASGLSRTAANDKTPFHMTFGDPAIRKCRNELLAWVPNYAVFCRKGASPSQSASLRLSKAKASWLDMSQSTSAEIRPVLVDDFRLPVTGCGVSVSSLLNGTQGFQPIGILDHVANKGDSTSELALLEKIDRVIHRTLLIPSTSDSKSFSVEVRTGGAAQYLDEASQRLSVVMLLLSMLLQEADSGYLSCNDSLFNCCLPLIKYDSLSVTLKCPPHKEGSPDKITTSHFALRGPLVTPSETIKGVLDVLEECMAGVPESSTVSRKSKVRAIYLAGEAEDYAAEIEEFVLSHLFGKHHKIMSCVAVRKVLSLLSYIEDGSKFGKLFSRQFLDFTSFPDSEEIVNNSNTLAIKKAIKAINSSLVTIYRTIEVCGASDAPRGFKMTEDVALGSDAYLSGADRGVSNLPAWMNSDKTAISPEINPSKNDNKKMSGDKELISPSIGTVAPLVGVGRGVNNLPAWMTSGDSAIASGISEDISSAQAEAKIEEYVASFDQQKQRQVQKDVDSFFESLPSTLCDREGTPTALQGIGRGRGSAINIPAWMTAGSTLESYTEDLASSTPVAEVKPQECGPEDGVIVETDTVGKKRSRSHISEDSGLTSAKVDSVASLIKDKIDSACSSAKSYIQAGNPSMALASFAVVTQCGEFFGIDKVGNSSVRNIGNSNMEEDCRENVQKRGKYGYSCC